MRALTIAGLMTLVAAAPAPAPELRLGFSEGHALAQVAVRAATARKLPVCVVVTNAEGRVIVALRMDGASFVTLDVAQAKALTAATLGVPSRTVYDELKGGEIAVLSTPHLIAIGGGLPIRHGETVVGGIGISGGTPEQDEAIAEAALAAATR